MGEVIVKRKKPLDEMSLDELIEELKVTAERVRNLNKKERSEISESLDEALKELVEKAEKIRNGSRM